MGFSSHAKGPATRPASGVTAQDRRGSAITTIVMGFEGAIAEGFSSEVTILNPY